MKKIYLNFLWYAFPLLSMQHETTIRAQLHDHSPIGQAISTTKEDIFFKQNVRAFLHDGTLAQFNDAAPLQGKILDDKTPLTPMSPYDCHPQYLLESYKNGDELTLQQKKIVIAYLHRQIELNRYAYEIGHSSHTAYILRMFGIMTIPLRWGFYKCIQKYSEWEKDLQELSVEETIYTYS